jgi:hypothetical protein
MQIRKWIKDPMFLLPVLLILGLAILAGKAVWQKHLFPESDTIQYLARPISTYTVIPGPYVVDNHDMKKYKIAGCDGAEQDLTAWTVAIETIKRQQRAPAVQTMLRLVQVNGEWQAQALFFAEGNAIKPGCLPNPAQVEADGSTASVGSPTSPATAIQAEPVTAQAADTIEVVVVLPAEAPAPRDYGAIPLVPHHLANMPVNAYVDRIDRYTVNSGMLRRNPFSDDSDFLIPVCSSQEGIIATIEDGYKRAGHGEQAVIVWAYQFNGQWFVDAVYEWDQQTGQGVSIYDFCKAWEVSNSQLAPTQAATPTLAGPRPQTQPTQPVSPNSDLPLRYNRLSKSDLIIDDQGVWWYETWHPFATCSDLVDPIAWANALSVLPEEQIIIIWTYEGTANYEHGEFAWFAQIDDNGVIKPLVGACAEWRPPTN